MIDLMKKRLYVFRSNRVARDWPVKRMLTEIDLELSEAEQRAMIYRMHDWRQLVPKYLARFGAVGEQIYCFGVAHGSTVARLVMGFRNQGMAVPYLHLFDSFAGLPDEDTGISVPPVWGRGAFAAPRAKLEAHIQEVKLPKDSYSVHEGWFKNTLDAKLVSNGTFKPAAYVDIDADLYNSTRDVLDFMFAHKLIRAGTLIGYDDWGDTDPWTAGESRAHKEIIAKYDARCAQLFSFGKRPLIRKLFLVVGVGR